MTKVGYARVSTLGQSLDVQKAKLENAGVDKLFEEKRSGLDSNRPALKECLNYLREGDTLFITRIDRLARSASDLLRVVKDLENRKVAIQVLDQSIDTSTSAGKAFLGMLAVFAEFENNIRRERQMDGIAKAKAKGIRFGRKKELTHARIVQIKQMREAGKTISEIIKASGLARATIYRALAKDKQPA
jgi:DNA invertase Pin-like site-specific DNA recombinase